MVTGLLRRDAGDKARALPVGLLPTGVHNYFAAAQHIETGKLCGTGPMSRVTPLCRQLMRATLSIVQHAAVRSVDVMQLATPASTKPSFAMVALHVAQLL